MTALADADPALLVRQARSMVIVPGQEKTAAMMLNSVKMKHPEQQGLWIALGDLAAKGGEVVGGDRRLSEGAVATPRGV